MRIAVIGGTGRTGRRVVGRLCALGHTVTAIGRSVESFARLDMRARRRAIDLERPDGLAEALAGAQRVVSCAHARFTAVVLEALPERAERFVAMGSVRRFLALADHDGDAVRAAEDALAASRRPAVMLHASMIYGSPDDGNVGRVLALLRRWPRPLPIVLPLPEGGRRRLQPIFVDDVVTAVIRAVSRDDAMGDAIVLAGPQPMTYAELVQDCARLAGRSVHVVTLPTAALAAAARVAARLGLPLPFSEAELRRAGEDKSFDIGPMQRRLGVEPIGFTEGLRRMAREGDDDDHADAA